MNVSEEDLYPEDDGRFEVDTCSTEQIVSGENHLGKVGATRPGNDGRQVRPSPVMSFTFPARPRHPKALTLFLRSEFSHQAAPVSTFT